MLKILFVSSGNSEQGISPVVQSQGESLKKAGIDVAYSTVIGKGLKGYLKNVFPLRRHIKQNRYDIVHAHYALSALTATLTGCRPLVVSLMGSDIRLSFVFRMAVKVCSACVWSALIVKSKDMQKHIGINKCETIPNGVNAGLFLPGDQEAARGSLGWDQDKKHVLFAANPAREVKNFPLLEKAYSLLNANHQLELHVLENVSHNQIPTYMNAADVAILPSKWEGSPNVIKEAMACNCPVVATDVGDIAWLFGNEPGHFLAGFDPRDVAEKLKLALQYAEECGKTSGRERIVELGLDAETVAGRIVGVYEAVLKKR